MERGHLFSYLTYLIVLFGKGFFDDVEFPGGTAWYPAAIGRNTSAICASVKSHLLQNATGSLRR